jgi:glycosyltransferase involved in cell wall biosynthesis
LGGSAQLPLVLFVHGSAEMYGSDKVLLSLAQAVAQGQEFMPVVLLHEEGPLHVALAAVGIEVHVCNVVKITRAMLRLGMPVNLLKQAGAALADFDRVVAGRRVALVHSNTLAVLGGALWSWRRHHQHLWHVHEIILKPAPVRLALPWLAQRLSHRVIANSSPTQAWLLSQAPSLVDRCEVVFNGLAPVPEPDPAAVKAFRNQIRATDADIVATVAGRLNHWKGQGLLIEAMALLQQQGRLGRLRLAIVGDVFAGHEHIRAALVSQVQSLGLEGRVQFVSFVADIYPVWRGSQIAVVPSTEPEPFGMVAIEAMACRLPVLAAGHGGLLDIVRDQETGLLFEPRNAQALAQALYTLATDEALRVKLGDAGQKRQQAQFSLRRQIEHTLAIYRTMLDQR